MKQEKRSTAEKVREAVLPPEPMRPKIERASHQLTSQVGKLDTTLKKLKERDRSIFDKAVKAVERHDTQSASALSNEAAEVKKMTRLVEQSKVALEQINMRLSTVKDLGDIITTVAPVIGVLRSVSPGLASIMPEAERDLGNITSGLGDVLIEAGQLGGFSLNFEVANEEAEKILSEAGVVAESRMKEALPNLPGFTDEKLGTTTE